MKIYTRVVMDWDGNTIEEESYEYDGPVAQCGGGGGKTETETNTVAEPWEGVQPYLKNLYGDVNQLYGAGMPDYYPGQTFVNRDPLENLAQAQNLAYAQGPMGDMIGSVQNTNQFMLGAPDVANNPYVSGMADVIERRMNRNLIENQLPAINHGAIAAGQMGGSARDKLERMAIRDTQEGYGDALAQLYGDAYESGLEQQQYGMALAPQSIQMGMAPSDIMGQVGAYRRGEEEQALQEDMSRYNYATQSPYENINWAMSQYMGAPWGGSTTAEMPGSSTSPLMGALGGGLMGASAAPMLSSALGLANPVTWPFALGGAVLGGLFG